MIDLQPRNPVLLLIVLGTLVVACGSPAPAKARATPPQEPKEPRAAAPVPEAAEPSPPSTTERTTLNVGPHAFSLHLPAPPPPLPSVLVLHSAMGRTESVLETCDRLAASGFAAVAFDFYDGEVAASRDDVKPLRDAANARAESFAALIEQTFQLMKTDARLQAQERFLFGFSYGAAWATYSGGNLPGLNGIVAYYGEMFSSNEKLYDQVTAPLLLIGGREDTGPAPEQLQAIAERVGANGNEAEVVLFPAGHGFAEKSHPGYDSEVTSAAFDVAVSWLEQRAR